MTDRHLLQCKPYNKLTPIYIDRHKVGTWTRVRPAGYLRDVDLIILIHFNACHQAYVCFQLFREQTPKRNQMLYSGSSTRGGRASRSMTVSCHPRQELLEGWQPRGSSRVKSRVARTSTKVVSSAGLHATVWVEVSHSEYPSGTDSWAGWAMKQDWCSFQHLSLRSGSSASQ